MPEVSRKLQNDSLTQKLRSFWFITFGKTEITATFRDTRSRATQLTGIVSRCSNEPSIFFVRPQTTCLWFSISAYIVQWARHPRFGLWEKEKEYNKKKQIKRFWQEYQCVQVLTVSIQLSLDLQDAIFGRNGNTSSSDVTNFVCATFVTCLSLVRISWESHCQML